jgi:hypothetical protein
MAMPSAKPVEAFVEALKTNKTLEEIHVGNLMVGCTVRLKSSGEETVVTKTGVYNDGTFDNIKVQGSDSKIKPSEFDPIPAVIPVKQLRENTITSLDLSNKGLCVDGGLILAALIKDNTSVQQLDASSNSLGIEGGKALAASIAENRTITSVSQQQYAFFLLLLTFFSLFFSLFPPVPFFSIYLGYVAQSFRQQDPGGRLKNHCRPQSCQDRFQ